MEEITNIIGIPTFFQNRIYKKIKFSKDSLTIEKTKSFEPPIFLAAENILSFRFGVNWIRGYKFTFGRQYIIELLDSQEKITSIKLTSYYQIRRKQYAKIWSDIINQLWSDYFNKKLNYYHELYLKKEEFTLSDVNFHPFGIGWYDGSMFWNEIALSNYITYFMIHKKEDLKKIKRCSFKNDWDALVLQSLLKKIIEEHDSYKNPIT
jgi:hypothetical protein